MFAAKIIKMFSVNWSEPGVALKMLDIHAGFGRHALNDCAAASDSETRRLMSESPVEDATPVGF
jgi:hypothetical protein